MDGWWEEEDHILTQIQLGQLLEQEDGLEAEGEGRERVCVCERGEEREEHVTKCAWAERQRTAFLVHTTTCTTQRQPHLPQTNQNSGQTTIDTY